MSDLDRSLSTIELSGELVWSDLKYEYTWKAYQQKQILEFSRFDSGVFDSNDGYQVITFINAFAARHRLLRRRALLKVEKLIRKTPTGESISRIQVCRWIEENW